MTAELSDEIELRIAGQSFTSWQGVTVTAQIDALARFFELQIPYDRRGGFPPVIVPGALCEILMNGRLLITGYVDEINSYKTAKNHSRAIVGRSITRNLVDSSIVMGTNQLNNLTPYEICKKIASDPQRFNIEIINEAPDQRPIPVLRWSDAAKAGSIMQDVCRQQGLTIRDNEKGQLVIRRPNIRRSRGAIFEGTENGNIEGWRIKRSEAERFNKYIVKGRSSRSSGQPANQKVGIATDTGVKPHRPLIVQAESDTTNALNKRRAQHEAQKRIALSYPANVTVSGWRNRLDGEPWEVDHLVPVNIPSEDFAGELLIRSFNMSKTESGGTITKLDLVDPAAYAAEPTAQNGKAQKATFGANKHIVDLGPARTILDGAGVQ